jgi:hypothetical protein
LDGNNSFGLTSYVIDDTHNLNVENHCILWRSIPDSMLQNPVTVMFWIKLDAVNRTTPNVIINPFVPSQVVYVVDQLKILLTHGLNQPNRGFQLMEASGTLALSFNG